MRADRSDGLMLLSAISPVTGDLTLALEHPPPRGLGLLNLRLSVTTRDYQVCKKGYHLAFGLDSLLDRFVFLFQIIIFFMKKQKSVMFISDQKFGT